MQCPHRDTAARAVSIEDTFLSIKATQQRHFHPIFIKQINEHTKLIRYISPHSM